MLTKTGSVMNKEVIQFFIDGSHSQRNKNLLVYGIMMSDEHGEHFLVDKKCCIEYKQQFNLWNKDLSFGSTDSEMWSFYSLLKLILTNKEKFENKIIQIYTDSQSVQLLFFGNQIPSNRNHKMIALYLQTQKLLEGLKKMNIECYHVNGHKDSWGNILVDKTITKWSQRFSLNSTKKNNKEDICFDTITNRLKSTNF